MTLNELIRAVDALSEDELAQLRDYINHRQFREQTNTELRPGTTDVDALIEAIDQMREGLTEQQLDEIVAAMNEEYIEPFDESEWRE